MWKWLGLFLRKNLLLRCLGWLSLLNWIGALTLSLLLKLSNRIGDLIRSMMLISPEVTLYLYKSTKRSGTPSCYLQLLDMLQKRICRTVGPSLAASLETLAYRRNVASLSLFYRYYFRRYYFELAQLVPFLYSRGRSPPYSDRLHDFFVTIPWCYKDSMSIVSFLAQADSGILCL